MDAPELDNSTPTRAELIDAIRYHNDTAKAMRRQGYTQTAGAAYARLHGSIDNLLEQLESTP